MSIEWPESLNYYAERSTYQLTPHDELSRSDYDMGPARVRRRFTNETATVAFSVLMEYDQFEAFKGFYASDLNNGAKWFYMPIWTGSFYLSHLVRFSQRYQASDYDSVSRMRVSFSLTVRNFFTLTGFAADLVGEYGQETALSWANRLHKAVHVSYPAAV